MEQGDGQPQQPAPAPTPREAHPPESPQRSSEGHPDPAPAPDSAPGAGQEPRGDLLLGFAEDYAARLRAALEAEEEAARAALSSRLPRTPGGLPLPDLALSAFAASVELPPQAALGVVDERVRLRRHLPSQDPLVLADLVLLKEENRGLRRERREREQELDRLEEAAEGLHTVEAELRDATRRAAAAEAARRGLAERLDTTLGERDRVAKELRDLRGSSAPRPHPAVGPPQPLPHQPAVEELPRGQELLRALAEKQQEAAEVGRLRAAVRELQTKGTPEMRGRIQRQEQQVREAQRRAAGLQVQRDADALAAGHKLQALERRLDSMRAAYVAVLSENSRLSAQLAAPSRSPPAASSAEREPARSPPMQVAGGGQRDAAAGRHGDVGDGGWISGARGPQGSNLAAATGASERARCVQQAEGASDPVPGVSRTTAHYASTATPASALARAEPRSGPDPAARRPRSPRRCGSRSALDSAGKGSSVGTRATAAAAAGTPSPPCRHRAERTQASSSDSDLRKAIMLSIEDAGHTLRGCALGTRPRAGGGIRRPRHCRARSPGFAHPPDALAQPSVASCPRALSPGAMRALCRVSGRTLSPPPAHAERGRAAPPCSPRAGRHRSSPAAGRLSSSPRAGRHRSSPRAGRHRSSPTTGRHSSSPRDSPPGRRSALQGSRGAFVAAGQPPGGSPCRGSAALGPPPPPPRRFGGCADQSTLAPFVLRNDGDLCRRRRARRRPGAGAKVRIGRPVQISTQQMSDLAYHLSEALRIVAAISGVQPSVPQAATHPSGTDSGSDGADAGSDRA